MLDTRSGLWLLGTGLCGIELCGGELISNCDNVIRSSAPKPLLLGTLRSR